MTNFEIQLALNKVPGKYVITKYGRNPDIDTADGFEVVWNGGGDNYTGFNAVNAETFEIFSSSTEDNPSGLGLGKIKLFILDENLERQEIEIELDGTDSVFTTAIGLRCDSVEGIGDGTLASLKTNIGEITVRQSTTIANIFAVIPIGYNSTMIACTTIPKGYTGLLKRTFASLANKDRGISNIKMHKREYGGVPVTIAQSTILADGSSFAERNLPFFSNPIPEKTDIWITADVSVDNLAIAAGFDILCVKNR